MTRPFGRSPARSKPRNPHQLELNHVPLIDVGAEDDTLLPVNGKASQHGSPGHSLFPHSGASPFKGSSVRTLASIREDQPEGEEDVQDVLGPLPTEEPAVKKKKKKTGFNLRKSLAWNNAFFTEEGVLDAEELCLVNRTFRKPMEQPKAGSNKKPVMGSKLLNHSNIPKINFSPVRMQKPGATGGGPKRADLPNHTVKGTGGSKPTFGISSTKMQPDHSKHDKLSSVTHTELHGQKPSPSKKHTLRPATLPACSNPKPPLGQQRSVQTISSTLSSTSRKMKDKLGMVFTGRKVENPRGGTSLNATANAALSSSRLPSGSNNANLTRCYSHLPYNRFGRSMFATSNEPVTSNIDITRINGRSHNLNGTKAGRGATHGFASNEGSLEARTSCLRQVQEQMPAQLSSHPQPLPGSSRPPLPTAEKDVSCMIRDTDTTDSLLSRAKPSGLRLPSPKLGFFDKARTLNTTNVAALRERTNGLGYEAVLARNVGVHPPCDTGGISSSAKQSYGSMRFVSKQGTDIGTVYGFHNQSSMTSMAMNYPEIGGSGSASSNTTAFSRPPTLNHGSSSAVDAQSTTTDGCSSTSCGSPLTVRLSSSISHSSITTDDQLNESSHAVLQVKKNGQNVLPMMRKMVSHLTLSPLRKASGQENALAAGHLQDKTGFLKSPLAGEKAYTNQETHDTGASGTLEEPKEEWPQVKSGAVQHSPPNKEPPKYGPWSPVRRNIQELGPFDCTKHTNNALLH